MTCVLVHCRAVPSYTLGPRSCRTSLCKRLAARQDLVIPFKFWHGAAFATGVRNTTRATVSPDAVVPLVVAAQYLISSVAATGGAICCASRAGSIHWPRRALPRIVVVVIGPADSMCRVGGGENAGAVEELVIPVNSHTRDQLLDKLSVCTVLRTHVTIANSGQQRSCRAI